MKLSRKLIVVSLSGVAIVLAAWAATVVFSKHAHESQFTALWNRADSANSTAEDVRQYARFSDKRVARGLEVIANDDSASPAARVEAIEELGRRAFRLSGMCSLLEWREPLDVIEAVLRDLKSRGNVSLYCVKQMLDYERLSTLHRRRDKGDDAKERAIGTTMDDLMRSVPDTTVTALQEKYALGTDQFDAFGLTRAVELHLSAACPLVRSSATGIAHRLGTIPEQVRRAETALCKGDKSQGPRKSESGIHGNRRRRRGGALVRSCTDSTVTHRQEVDRSASSALCCPR